METVTSQLTIMHSKLQGVRVGIINRKYEYRSFFIFVPYNRTMECGSIVFSTRIWNRVRHDDVFKFSDISHICISSV